MKKRELLEIVGKVIYDLYLEKQDKSEKIVKVLYNGVYITQNKNGIGYTKIYAFGKMIFSQKTLDLNFCNHYSIFDCKFNIKNNYELSKEKISILQKNALKKIKYKTIKNINELKIIEIYSYETISPIILNFKNKKVIIGKPWEMENLINFKKGKSGYFFISEGHGSPILYFIDNNGNLKELYQDETKTNYIIDYELMINKRIKLFYSNGEEKIIKLD